MTHRIAFLLPCLALLGCAVGEDATPLGTAEGAVTSTNRLSLNRLSLNSLSMDRLSSDGLNLNATDLLLSDAGRELLRYTVRCALPEGQTLTATVGSTSYTFNGGVGLARDWVTKPLKEKDQRWISACLLAHVNGYGIEVPVSLRGNHPALTTTQTERELFVNEEISFYGNVFQKEDAEDDEVGDSGLRMYSCGSTPLRLSCDASAFGPTRSCAENVDCALKFVGACQAMTIAHPNLCDVVKAGIGYSHCHTAERSWLGHKTSVDYKEVITVYLQQSDFGSLYPRCVDE